MAEPTPTPDVRLLRSLTLRNILSFGPDTPPLELRALNVLIGPNGSGKSNLLDAVELLKKAPDAENLKSAVRGEHWFYKSKQKQQSIEIEAIVTLSNFNEFSIHNLKIHDFSPGNWRITERIDVAFYKTKNGEPNLSTELEFESSLTTASARSKDELVVIPKGDFNNYASCLFQLRGIPYSVLTIIGHEYRRIRLYREWTFGRNSGPRLPRPTDERNDFLAEDGSNLGLVLNKLRTYPEIKDQFIAALNELYEGIKDFEVLVEGNTAQIFLREANTMIPATRLSDGTLRYLCLLAILLHPTPPPLICLEEPELGLHPDAVVAVGKLIKEASTRTQLIITTHSSMLLDVLSESPEDVVVCSKRDGATHMQRLDAEKLAAWLKDYSLGELWNSGQIGGNRW